MGTVLGLLSMSPMFLPDKLRYNLAPQINQEKARKKFILSGFLESA